MPDFDSDGREIWSLQARSSLTAIRTFDMRKIILALALLYPAAAFAQTTTTPASPGAPTTVGGKPLVQVGSKKSAAGKKEAAAPQSVAQKLQACQDTDDATKEKFAPDNFPSRFGR